MMRTVDYRDHDGRQWRVLLPEGVPDSDAHMGLPVGPPSLESLNLPLALEVRLHNELFRRSLLTARDVKRNPDGVAAAWRSAIRTDTMDIIALYG